MGTPSHRGSRLAPWESGSPETWRSPLGRTTRSLPGSVQGNAEWPSQSGDEVFDPAAVQVGPLNLFPHRVHPVHLCRLAATTVLAVANADLSPDALQPRLEAGVGRRTQLHVTQIQLFQVGQVD